MFFNLVLFIYTLIYLPFLLLSDRGYKGYACRLGFWPSSLKARLGHSSRIWIHAVSVGEVMAITPLIATIKTKYPNDTIVLTVTTKTGYALAQDKLASKAVIIPSPLDFTWIVSSFVRLIKPKIYIVAETEIWPNLFSCLHKNNIPIVIINGRISDRSFGRYKAIKPLLQGVLKKVSLFAMQSDMDKERIIELGAPVQKVFSVGNIKFDEVGVGNGRDRSLENISNRSLLWIAGSTHPGEEELVLKAYLPQKNHCSLIIAPRHVERTSQVISLVESYGLNAIRFSQLPGAALSPDTVIVVDTIGQLRALYAQASFVFVGKSLCVGGGHNIIEPAQYAKAIIVGPMMENFRDITALFKAQDALLQVKDGQELADQVGQLIQDAGLRTQLGQKALAVVKANQGALERTIALLGQWIRP